uniref:UV radiation resistance-associated gene protein n=1 Tax=Aceria tosichella TaxID=561515 RepID=A0A6G1SPX7_9ACAR
MDPDDLAKELKRTQQRVFLRRQQRLNLLNSELSLAKSHIISRTKLMARDLWDIYPISEFPDRRGYSICDIYLPSSDHLEGHDATMISVAIGYVGHLLLLLSDILDITLRFPLKYYGSKSLIYCNRRNQQFPLHVDSTKGRDWVNFCYGMSLLNLDIVQIRTLYGLSTSDPGETLANLHELKIILAREELS